jgi:hypothetical protein
MKRALTCVLLGGAALLSSAGCDALADLIGPTRVTVVLVNAVDDFSVEATVIYDDIQEIPEAVLLETGEQLEYTIAAGDSVTFSRPCDELQAIMIEDADLLVLPGIGPETSSDVQRDGDDFSCGDTLVFTFTGGATDLNVSVSTR